MSAPSTIDKAVPLRDIPIQTIYELLNFELINVKDVDILSLKTADGELKRVWANSITLAVFFKKLYSSKCQVQRERSPISGLIAWTN